MLTVDDVRSFAAGLPRTTEALVHDRVKFRVGQIVYVAFSRDETVMGFAFAKEERELQDEVFFGGETYLWRTHQRVHH